MSGLTTLAGDFQQINTMVAALGSFAVIGWLLYIVLRSVGDSDRDQEEAAREYFDRYGRWPDDD